MKLRKNRKGNLFILIFVFFIFVLFYSFKFINSKISPILFDYAFLESRKFASIIINSAISENITENVSVDELFLMSKKSNGDIETIDFNPIVVNKILTKITSSVQNSLKLLEQGKVDSLSLSDELFIDYDIDNLKKGIICTIPSGVVFNNSLLANIGPKIPVKLNLAGDIVSYINTKVTNYGINNALIEVNIVLELTEQVILPFNSSKIKIETSIPVALKLIQGSVPEYYLNGLGQNSTTFSLPIK